ncbi:MAG: Phospho-2-dehydro-3-deoxyheptonate aldolase [Chlamydiae bacterium]|nr:Phospho-2-dehydro-3-deoxyheptonate aldolase [Chlamydiota bacterium]
MILELAKDIDPKQLGALADKLEWMGFNYSIHKTDERTDIAIISGSDSKVDINQFKNLPYVENVSSFKQSFKLAGKELREKSKTFQIEDVTFGQGHFSVMAGPCSIEGEEQIFNIAEAVSSAGAKILRGGAFKPRSSPYSFQGLGKEGLKLMQKAAAQYKLLTVSEIMDAEDLPLIEEYVDILQVGARNMQNFSLLKKLGKTSKPILLKRGLSATYQEFLMSAEYILSGGNERVILCERGIRTFEPYTRNTLDIAAIPILKSLSHLPVIADPSHGTGIRSLVAPMSKAAIAAGADGLMIEVHPEPDKALSDAAQTISLEDFSKIMGSILPVNKQLVSV